MAHRLPNRPTGPPNEVPSQPPTGAPDRPAAAPGRAHRRRALVALVVAALLGSVGLAGVAPAPAGAFDQWQNEMLAMVNQQRAAAGLGPVQLCETLTSAAMGHSADMVANNYFSHTSLDGRSPADRANQQGYGSSYVGENIAYGQSSAQAVMAAWMGSSGHRANILNPNFTHSGFGLAYKGNTPYWTQDFGAWGTCSRDPVGSLDSAWFAGLGQIGVSGWTIDPASPAAAVGVHLYVNGGIAAVVTANQPRSDVQGAVSGAGPYHGFGAVLDVPGGTHTVCAYAISVDGGTNPLLGCRTVTVVGRDPFGGVDQANQLAPGAVHVRGWGLDLETTGPIQVHLYVDGAIAKVVTADTERPDVAGAFAGYGPYHGFDTTLSVPSGFHTVCAYGINAVTGTVNPLLGCRQVTVGGSPFGSHDAAFRTGPTTVRTTGWVLDPDIAGPTQVAIYVGGTFFGWYPAGQPRPDIGGIFPAWGPNHGFDVELYGVVPGAHPVCAYGIDVGVGSNSLLGCRTLPG